jgi:flagellar basal-body rod modification protein FlgD
VTVATDTLQLDGGKVNGSIAERRPAAGTKLVLTGSDGQQTTIDLAPRRRRAGPSRSIRMPSAWRRAATDRGQPDDGTSRRIESPAA